MMIFQLHIPPLPKAIYSLPRVGEFPSQGFLVREGFEKSRDLPGTCLSRNISPCPAPFSFFPSAVRKSPSRRGQDLSRSFLKRGSNLLPSIWYLSERWWGARPPGGSGQDPNGLHNAGPCAPADGGYPRGTGHRAKQWVRGSRYRGSTQTPSSCKDSSGKPSRGQGSSQASAAQGPASNAPGGSGAAPGSGPPSRGER